MNINKVLDKAYETKSLKEIVNAPVAAIEGISENDAKLLEQAFKVRTIGDLGRQKFFLWAQALVVLAEGEE